MAFLNNFLDTPTTVYTSVQIDLCIRQFHLMYILYMIIRNEGVVLFL